SCMPEDDDTNYTLFSLLMLERYGRDFTAQNIAHGWMNMFPILRTCTAERVAYKNFTAGIMPPRSAEYRNPYREWIGAQIRTDFYGYINPGNPALAAEYAFRDASVSHVKNGIYGAMFVAAMIAAAGVLDKSGFDAADLIKTGMSYIPAKSRLYEALELFLEFYAKHPSWEDAQDYIHQNYNEYDPHDWCHTIPNALVVCLGLLYGDGDFSKSISLAVTPMFDTDCNGATVGSILGIICGASAIPDYWKNPINDSFETGLAGLGKQSITDLAKRTCLL
ncbi:MAG: ADP-ribosylglycohydrolase family protein, partial [Oscillospiraceae bacterium]|nr:ADP-ribosylglycohydrolase family protein [Oscillospiraceae bacterium]